MKTITKDKKQKEKIHSIDKTQIQIPLSCGRHLKRENTKL